MTIGAVTARSRGGLVPANQNRAPRTAQIIQLRKTVDVRTRIPRSVSTRGLKHAIRNRKVQSVRKIAQIVTGKVVRTVARSNPLSLAAIIGLDYLYNKVVAPDDFPGFDNIGEGWRDEQHHLGYVPGDYVPNMFDVGPFGPPPSRALLDSDDASIPLGIRYWGDFGVDPYAVPGTVGDNWPVDPIWLPNPSVAPSPAPLPLPRVLPSPRYNPQRDLSKRFRPRPRWRPRNNIQVLFRIGSSTAAHSSVRVTNNVPRVTGPESEGKAKPANQFVYAVLKNLANAMGETKEWIDILAEAAGYDRESLTAPAAIQKGHETVKKAWWLFVDQGINNIDFELLAVLVIENEIEDFVIGIAGQMSKSAAQSLNLTVGPQTGLAL